MRLLRRLLVTIAAIAIAAGCVTPEETSEDAEIPPGEQPTAPTAGLDDTNQTGVPEGDAGTFGVPGPDPEYAADDEASS